ncbi:DEKNAAC102687 [Brettanomyces naardenensis]|uniref:DEKNAAC102687 n=1 Tax=Brettanomyces naardenensis TaxID=13370 RepID=A0A448YKM4_BRENA|nr:DEKNAAC102687 [Brettanomyces naardenensis]
MRWFVLVAIFGTAVFVKIAHRIRDDENNTSFKNKTVSYSEEEWQDHVEEMRRKRFQFRSGEEFYLFPFASNSKDKTKRLVTKLGGEETVGVIDLNDLIKEQLEDPSSRYGTLLSETLDKEDEGSNTCRYIFTYVLAPGVFTQLVKDRALKLREENPKITRFAILNYPNTIPEAVKFEQKVATVSKLVVAGKEPKENNIIDYFSTVDKVINIDKLPKMEPKVVDRSEYVKSKPASKAALSPALEQPPADDAPMIKKAQYRLREIGEPIRRYGETDRDVIERLSKLTKDQN